MLWETKEKEALRPSLFVTPQTWGIGSRVLCPERIPALVTKMDAWVRGCYRISLKLPLQGGSMEQNVSSVIMGEKSRL